MSADKVFVDANVLVYAHDVSAGNKRDVAHTRIADLWKTETGVLSTQVLQEFFVITTRKLPKPLDVPTAEKAVIDLLQWDVVVNDERSIPGAIELLRRYALSFWDALVLHAALQAGAKTLLSEDFQHGQEIRGTRIENPFV
jgi:predicted nucleic acid-binding protein